LSPLRSSTGIVPGIVTRAEDYCRLKGHEYCRIDGNTGGEDRDRQMDEYNAPGSSKFVFLLSTRAGE